MIQTSLYMTEKQFSYIDNLASQKGITFSEALRRLLDEYLDRMEKETVITKYNA